MRAPCEATANEMSPAPEGDYCHSCQETVHDLSKLTFREADTLLREHGTTGRSLCVALTVRRVDGATLLLDGYAKGYGAPAKRRLPLANAGALASALLLAACADAPPVIPALPTPVHVPPEVVAPPVVPTRHEPPAPPPTRAPVAAAAEEEQDMGAPEPVPQKPQPAGITTPKPPKLPHGKKPGHDSLKGGMMY